MGEAVTILVVDDDPDVGELLELTLSTDGYEVVLVRDGRAALAVLATRRFALVIVDLVMPVMNGWELIAQMRAQRLDVPVCVITALGENVPADAAVALLRKPFDLGELRALVRRLGLAAPGQVTQVQ